MQQTKAAFTQNTVKKAILNRGYYLGAASRKVVIRDFIQWIQDLQQLPWQLVNNLRGRSRIKYGMTTLFNNSGFTLIELLVVVLIIGILAAIAVPQYQKAVAKSRAVQLITNAHTIRQALRLYYLTTGEKMSRMSQLDIWDSITPAAPNRYETATLNGITFTYITQSQTINFNIQFPGYHSWSCNIYPDGQRGFCYVYTEKDQSLAQSLGWDCSEKVAGVSTPWCNIGPNWNKL